MHMLEPRAIDVGVDLSCCNVGVAEEFLDDPEVGAAGEEMGGEAVSELVRVDAIEPCERSAFFNDLPDGDSFERTAGL